MEYPKGIEVIGSAIIENEKGEILLAKSPKWSNKWTMPGGHINPGETVFDATVREAHEETGLKLKALKIIGFGELIGSKDFHRGAHFIYFDVYCRLESNNLKLDNFELTQYKWVKPENALKLDLAETYDKTIKEFIKYKC